MRSLNCKEIVNVRQRHSEIWWANRFVKLKHERTSCRDGRSLVLLPLSFLRVTVGTLSGLDGGPHTCAGGYSILCITRRRSRNRACITEDSVILAGEVPKRSGLWRQLWFGVYRHDGISGIVKRVYGWYILIRLRACFAQRVWYGRAGNRTVGVFVNKNILSTTDSKVHAINSTASTYLT